MERHFFPIQNAFEEDMNQYLLKAKKIIHPIDEIKNLSSLSVEKNILSEFIIEQIYQYALLGRINESFVILKLLTKIKPQKEIVEYKKLYEMGMRFGELEIATSLLEVLLEKSIKQQKTVLLYDLYKRHEKDVIIPDKFLTEIKYLLGVEQSLVHLDKGFIASKFSNITQTSLWKKSLESYERMIDILNEEEHLERKFVLSFMYEYLLNSQSTPSFDMKKFKKLWEKLFVPSSVKPPVKEDSYRSVKQEKYKYDLTFEEKKQLLIIRNMNKKDLVQYSDDLFVNYINVDFVMAAELVVDLCLEDFADHLSQEKIINLYFLKLECLERRMQAVEAVEISTWCLDNLDLTPYEESLFVKIKTKNLGRMSSE